PRVSQQRGGIAEASLSPGRRSVRCPQRIRACLAVKCAGDSALYSILSLVEYLANCICAVEDLRLAIRAAICEMQTRKIGSLDISVIGLGCNNFGWRIDAKASAKVVDAAIASRIDFFDTADRYGNCSRENLLGH